MNFSRGHAATAAIKFRRASFGITVDAVESARRVCEFRRRRFEFRRTWFDNDLTPMWLPFISGRFPFSSRSAPVGRCSAPVRVLCGPFGSRSAPIGRCSAPVWVLCGSSSSDDFILIKLPRTRRHRGNKVEQVVLVALGCVGLCWVVLCWSC